MLATLMIGFSRECVAQKYHFLKKERAERSYV